MSEIVGGEFDEDPVAGEDADEIHSDFAADVSENAVSVCELDSEHGVRKGFHDGAFYLDGLFLGRGGAGTRFGLLAPLGARAAAPLPRHATTPASCGHLLLRAVARHVWVLEGVSKRENARSVLGERHGVLEVRSEFTIC
jgi:hypothetical protein